MFNGLIFFLFSSFSGFPSTTSVQEDIVGAWESSTVYGGQEARLFKIYTPSHFITSIHTEDEFLYANGGTWIYKDSAIVETFEFSTPDFKSAGQIIPYKLKIKDNQIILENSGYSWTWDRIDKNTLSIASAWIQQNTTSEQANKRRSIRLLSDSFFLKVTFDPKAKSFEEISGGAYSIVDGIYTETIQICSLQTRVGTEEQYKIEIQGDMWHQNNSSIRQVWLKLTR